MSDTHPQRLPLDKSGYLAQDTVASTITAIGGPVAIIRVSGPDAVLTLAKIAGEKAAQSEPRKMNRVQILHFDGSQIDDALIVKFVSPESFTGEDVVEYFLHGSGVIVYRLMETLAKLGVRQALPGEFSFRAVRNGKMTLSQSQAVADLIASKNEAAVELALEKLSGSQHTLVSALGEELRNLTTYSELGLDFSDQNIEELSLSALKVRLATVLEKLRLLNASYDRGEPIQSGLKTVLAGLPNAGKSSFFNALLGKDRSIVSDIPGTTRDLIHEYVTLRGTNLSVTLRLEDTAGLRQTYDPIEKIGVGLSRKAASKADLILFLVEKGSSLSEVSQEWKFFSSSLSEASEKTIGIISKFDLSVPGFSPDELKRELGISTWVEASVLDPRGLNQAIAAILAFSAKFVQRKPGEVLLTRIEDQSAVTAAIDHLNRALKANEADLFASDIRQALHSLSCLIGETVPDDILGRIFSNFCIGK